MRTFSGCGLLAAAMVSDLVVAASSHKPWSTTRRLEFRATNTTSAPAGVTSKAFNASATDNVGVYFGQAQNDDTPSMYPLCIDSNVDIVVLSFLRQFNGLDLLPNFDIGSTCESDGSSSTYTCPELAENITLCQSLGKKVLLSIGGSSSNITFNTTDQAIEAANILWNTFGSGTNTTSRPFGDVVLDGFDFDIESGSSVDNFDIFAEALQGLFKSSATERYITAAPLCANNTALPHGFYENSNFIWPRFYNAQACSMSGTGFNSSVIQWHDYIESVNSNVSDKYPLLYIGALSFDNENAGGGYVTPDVFASELIAIRPNISGLFGGVTFWEGSDALVTTNSAGDDYLEVAKTALDTVSATSAGTRVSGFGWQIWLITALALHLL